MTRTQKYYFVNDILIHIAFVIWASLAVFFYQERIFSDSGYYLSKVVHYETFWVELNRFILVFSQWLPLLFVKFGLSMKTVLIAYSIGHVFFFYCIYSIARFGYKNHQAVWMLLLVQTVGILYGFCAPEFEFYYGVGFLILWFVIFQHDPDSLKSMTIQILLLFFVITSHQISAMLFGGAILLHFSRHQWKYWKQYTILISFVFVCLVLKKIYAHSYDQQKMEMFLKMVSSYQFEDGFFERLISFSWEYYKELWALVLFTIVMYFRQKKHFTLVVYLLFIALMHYVVVLTYPAIKHSRYQEQCYFPLIVVGCFPFIMDLKNRMRIRWQYICSFGVFFLIVYRFVFISIAIDPYVHRISYMHRVIEAAQKIKGHKFIARESWWNPRFADMTFGIGMETMLLSAIDPSRKTIQIIRDNEWEWGNNSIAKTLQDTNLYLFTYRSFYDGKDTVYHHSNANPKYYNFPPGPYRNLNGNVQLADSLSQLKDIKIKTYISRTYKTNSVADVLIKISNNSSIPLNSEQFRIAFHWWKNGEVIQWDGQRNYIEMDLSVKQEYYQYISVKMPSAAGRYELQVDLVDDNSLGWLGYKSKVPVIVY